jgi:hypothetical protein
MASGLGMSTPLSKSDLVPEGEGFGEGPPLEPGPARQKWRKIEPDQQTISDEVSKYLEQLLL